MLVKIYIAIITAWIKIDVKLKFIISGFWFVVSLTFYMLSVVVGALYSFIHYAIRTPLWFAWNSTIVGSSAFSRNNPAHTGRKLNVHKAFRRRPGRLLNVLCTFNLRPVSTGKWVELSSINRFRPSIFTTRIWLKNLPSVALE